MNVNGKWNDMNAHDVMSVNIVAAKDNATAIEIATRLVLGPFNGLPIIDDQGKVTGIITTIDLLQAIKDGRNLDDMSAGDLMTRSPAVIYQDTTTTEMIDIMYRKRIDMLPVVEEDHRLIGIVSRQDILREKLNERFVTIERKTSTKR
ncbi:MAG TPA: CBS domain-containing protein [Candidatus Bathyarchaeia archaeon]|nr:CBS domain-containing protein [Candidatus Bathyarchaeia archaeon]